MSTENQKRPQPATNLTLSTPEWQAVAAAFGDASRCGCGGVDQPGAVRKLLHAVRSSRPPQPFADARLEAVRRFVCESHRYRKPAQRYASSLIDQGFNERQIKALGLLAL